MRVALITTSGGWSKRAGSSSTGQVGVTADNIGNPEVKAYCQNIETVYTFSVICRDLDAYVHNCA